VAGVESSLLYDRKGLHRCRKQLSDRSKGVTPRSLVLGSCRKGWRDRTQALSCDSKGLRDRSEGSRADRKCVAADRKGRRRHSKAVRSECSLVPGDNSGLRAVCFAGWLTVLRFATATDSVAILTCLSDRDGLDFKLRAVCGQLDFPKIWSCATGRSSYLQPAANPVDRY
jgi:hypothetical protein